MDINIQAYPTDGPCLTLTKKSYPDKTINTIEVKIGGVKVEVNTKELLQAVKAIWELQ